MHSDHEAASVRCIRVNAPAIGGGTERVPPPTKVGLERQLTQPMRTDKVPARAACGPRSLRL